MKKLFTLVMLLSIALGIQAENLPIAGGYHYAIKNLSGQVKVSFTKQYGDLGLCDKLPVSLNDYKGIRVEFAAPVSDQIQLDVQANKEDWIPAEAGATQIAFNFADRELSGTLTKFNLQSNKANESCTLKNAYLIKTNGTEELCFYNTAVGYNRDLDIYSADVEFQQQYAQIGGWDGVAGDTYTVNFGSAIPAQTFMWKYVTNAGDQYVDIEPGTTGSVTTDANYTGLCLLYKASGVATYKILSIVRNGEGGVTPGPDPEPEPVASSSLPIAGGYHYAIKNLSGQVKVSFTKQYGDLGLCDKLPVSLNDYKGIRVEFAAPVSDQIQLDVQANKEDWIPAEAGATQIAFNFADRELSGTLTKFNLQSNKANESCTLKNAYLIKTNGTEELCFYNTAVGYNRDLDIYSADVEFQQQYAQIGGWDGVAGDTYTVNFGSAIPAQTFMWKYVTNAGDQYVDIEPGTTGSVTTDANYTGMCLLYKASGVATYNIQSIKLNDDTTGTGALRHKLQMTDSQVVYDLQGRKVAQPTKGLYIVNGKKVILK